MPRIAYLGPQGTFTEAALLQMVDDGMVPWPGAVELVATESSASALQAVRDGSADYACVPIENSIDGSILPTLDSLANGSPLQVFAELTLDVAFSIVVRPGRTPDHVHTIAAFPIAAAQVRHWLAEHLPNAEVVPSSSNAAAALDVAFGRADAARHHDTGGAALRAHRVWRLASSTRPSARTRFVLAGRPGPPPPRTGADRTSVVLRIDNTPGALVAALTEFGIRDIDLTRIESRPTRTELGTYVFFLDCVGHIDDSAVAEALKALHRRCADVRYVGSWPTGAVTGAVPPEMDESSRWLARLRDGEPQA